MLYTSNVSKNLLYVFQFAKDNNVYFELQASHCVIRDPSSHKVLLREFESSGFYKLDL